jgi:hypothetical protein
MAFSPASEAAGKTAGHAESDMGGQSCVADRGGAFAGVSVPGVAVGFGYQSLEHFKK